MLIIVWISSGAIFGILMSGIVSNLVAKSGNFKVYDIASKLTLLVGIMGYILIGACYQFKFKSFVAYIFVMIIIGIGSIGYYGLVLLSLVETFYPLSSLLIGTLICLGASLYSALATGLG